MRYDNRLFPHPVLGIDDDVHGEFGADLMYRSDKDFITLSPTFKLTEDDLSNLIAMGKAIFVVQVYCRGTMFREIYKTISTIPAPIKIASTKLAGEVEVHFFVCSINSISKYYSENFNAEYNKTKFEVDLSDILAYGGKAKFTANKSPEELKSISSIIRVRNSQKKSHPMFNEYEGEKIEIMLCEEDYQSYQLTLRNRVFNNIIHSSIVLPALMDALYFMDKDEGKSYNNKRWYKLLYDLKLKSKTPEIFIIAQNILDQPNERIFGTILTLEENLNF
jgi:hypothetical protein